MPRKLDGKLHGLSVALASCLPGSLTGKQIVLSACLFAGFIWALVLISTTILRNQIEQVLSHEQFATTRHVASEINMALMERTDSLAGAARQLPTNLTPQPLSQHLSGLYPLHQLFSGGIVVIGLDGRIIASHPFTHWPAETRFQDQDYFRQVLARRQPYIDKPMFGGALKHPLLTVGVPVFDGSGKMRAVMVGITDLAAPNFLERIADPSLPGGSEITVFSVRDNVVVASSDSKRAMAPTPERGTNVMYDRFADGLQGSGIALDETGIRRLYSGVGVPSADWLVMAALPAEAAFQPVPDMQRKIYLIAALLTLLAVVLIGWVTRRTLAPLENARQALRRMTGGQAPLGPLPVERNDEVGQLIGSFNHLVEDRQRHEAALAHSRQKLRELSAHNESLLEEERRSIAREIHDELGQLLTALKMDCSLLRRTYPDDAYLQNKIEDMRSLLDNTIGVARHVVSNLRPPALDHGIIPAIEWLAEDFSLRWEMECNLRLDADDIILDDGRATALFRIIQESLTNVARHAQATRVVISLGRSGARVLLRIEDNGRGFDPKAIAKRQGFGLQGMRERALAQGGRMRVSSTPTKGTSVVVTIPL